MHDASLMALALIVSEKMTLNAKTRQKFMPPHTKPPEKQYICLASVLQARQKPWCKKCDANANAPTDAHANV